MAARSCKPEALPPKRQKFFKIVFDPQDHRLKIPTEFIRRHGHDFPDIVFLKVPTGSSWKVEVTRSENEIWLEKGWQEFKEHYSIEFGHFLVFEYQGNSQFNVIICDITATEIEYPLVNGPKMEDIGSESDDSDFIFLKELFTKQEGIKRPKAANSEMRSKKVVRAVDRKTCKAYQRAKSFKSENPFHISVVQPSCVSGQSSVTIPLSIAEENLPDKFNHLNLRVRDGKTWPVSCTISTQNAKIHSGWKKFVEENKLQVGDVCVFEVVNRKGLVWNVAIFRS